MLKEGSAVDAGPVLLAKLPLHPPQRFLHVRPGRTGGQLTDKSHRFALDGKNDRCSETLQEPKVASTSSNNAAF